MNSSEKDLQRENTLLLARVEEAEETLHAIRTGAVDALIVEGQAGPQIYLLQDVDAASNRFRSDILAKINDAVVAIDDGQHVIYLNAAAERQYGVSASEAMGNQVGQLYETRWSAPGDEEAAWDTLNQTGHSRYQNVHVMRSGQVIHVESSVSRLLDANGQPAGILSVIRDITAQRALEDALRDSEQRANNIIQSIADGFITMDREWRISYLSPRGADILSPLGKTPDHVIGRSFWEAFPGTAGTSVERKFRHAMEQQAPVQFEIHYDPLQRWFELRVYPSAEALSLFFLDITERKNTESALRASQNVLARQAGALQAADRSKNEFLAMLAHELRNPLAPLRNASEILAGHGAGTADRLDAQQVIDRQIGNMSRMIDDLLDVSRITEGKIELRRQPVTLEEILTAAASLARTGCAANQQQLEVRFPDVPVYLNADATRLEQVFGNLLSNAIKYSGKGTRISMTATLLEVNGLPSVEIKISDNGVGIDASLLPRIFGLFVQASRTLDRTHGGLGIGLTLVDRLVRLHGGTVTAHSNGHGQGAEFVVTLPILQYTPPTPIPQAAAAPDHGNPCRILVVDDNTDSARTLARLQTLRGHTARTAFTGPDAVTEAAEFLPEVVLLDIGLPGMDGFEVARRLRRMPGMENSLIVAMSGYGREEDRQMARQAGFDEYLVKPVDLASVRELIAKRSS